MNKQWTTYLLGGLLVMLGVALVIQSLSGDNGLNFLPDSGQKNQASAVVAFESATDFKTYLAAASGEATALGSAPAMSRELTSEIQADVFAGNDGAASGSADRVSGTNIQVDGVDEPDILKTDGAHLYYVPSQRYWSRPFELRSEDAVSPERESVTERMPAPDEPEADAMILAKPVDDIAGSPPPTGQFSRGTQIIQALPPEEMAPLGSVEASGNLLIADDRLIVIDDPDYAGWDAARKITGWDIDDPEMSSRVWTHTLDEDYAIETARLYDGVLYLVTRRALNRNVNCPMTSLLGQAELGCGQIYHPVDNQASVDTLYSIIKLDPDSGDVLAEMGFVGGGGSTVVMMSAERIYLTYAQAGDWVAYFNGFLEDQASDLVDEQTLTDLDRLLSYQLSQGARMTEFQVILERWYGGLSKDERRRVENELADRLADYEAEHIRELSTTGIVAIGTSELEVLDTTEVPGYLLNQFSMDEYNGHLRVATTSDGDTAWFGSGNSVNDVYVLDSNLKTVGEVLDLGLSERIYAVRFLGDMAYVVTFRQIDPFYVLDLTDPKDPQLSGELKIPGYSSYLHPIDQDRILGVGMDGSKVKLSLFDVSTPTDPKEIDQYLLDAYWSDVLNTHRAFLLDARHNAFFLPAGADGMIFEYTDDELRLARVVSDIQAKRAAYLDDTLYVLGDEAVVALDESDWTEVGRLSLTADYL